MADEKKNKAALILALGKPAQEDDADEGGDSEAGKHSAAARVRAALASEDDAELSEALTDFVGMC